MTTTRRNWKQILAIILAATLLPAVPVSALTFLSPWRAMQTKRTNGAPRATIIPNFADGQTLLVDMGRTSSRGARSRVEASREFRITRNQETISVNHTFETLLQDARLKVKMKIVPQRGFDLQDVKYKDNGGRGQVFALNQNSIGRLPEGDYELRIRIDYKNKNGKWDNTPPPPGSPHTFSIRSL